MSSTFQRLSVTSASNITVDFQKAKLREEFESTLAQTENLEGCKIVGKTLLPLKPTLAVIMNKKNTLLYFKVM